MDQRILGLQGPCTIGVLHPLKQNEHLTVRGLREQVHSHSLDRSEGSTLDAVGRGPTKAVQDKAWSVRGCGRSPAGVNRAPSHPPDPTLTPRSCPWLPAGCRRRTAASGRSLPGARPGPPWSLGRHRASWGVPKEPPEGKAQPAPGQPSASQQPLGRLPLTQAGTGWVQNGHKLLGGQSAHQGGHQLLSPATVELHVAQLCKGQGSCVTGPPTGPPGHPASQSPGTKMPQESPSLRGGPRRRQWHPTPVLLLGKSHGRRSLLGCNPWGR